MPSPDESLSGSSNPALCPFHLRPNYITNAIHPPAYTAMGSTDSLLTFCSAVSLRLVLFLEIGALRPLAMTPDWSLTTAAFLNFFCACELLSSNSGQ